MSDFELNRASSSILTLVIAIIVLTIGGPAAAAAQSAATLRSRVFTPDLDAITGLAAPRTSGTAVAAAVQSDTLHLELFPGTAIDIEIVRRDHRAPDQATLVGRVAGDPLGVAYLAVDDDALAANIITGGARYEIRVGVDGRHVVREVSPDVALDCATSDDEAPPSGRASSSSSARMAAAAAAAPSPASVDLLVVYTAAAEAGAGGAAGIRSTIALAIAEANDALERSGVPHRYRLVRTARVSYVESGTLSTDLARLRVRDDGVMDDVFTLRDSVRADVVSLVVDSADHAGMANTMYSLTPDPSYPLWNVVLRGALSASLPHELGHNAGLLHDRDNAVNRTPLFPYGYGYRIAGKWSTIMAYSNCTGGACPRIPYFSNPQVSYQGTATGVADVADEARVLIQTLPILANGQTACVTAATPEVANVPANGGAIRVEVTTTGGCAWTVDAEPSLPTWLTPLSSSSTAGGGVVQSTAQPNTSNASRTATLNIGGTLVVIAQAARAATPTPPPTSTPAPPTTTSAPAPTSTTQPAPTFISYLAEGATGSFFSTRVALFNPTTDAAVTELRFMRDDGVVVTTATMVPGHGRVTVLPETIQGLASTSFSATVQSSAPLVVDRTMVWDKVGRYGSSAETSVPSPSTTWYLAEGSTTGNFSLFYLLQNPNATPVSARVRYLRPAGLAPIERVYALPPSSRTTIAVDQEGPELASTDVSAAISADAPIIVERSMYLSQPTRPGAQPFVAGHESAGITEPATHWFLAEGATGPFFDLFILLANPGTRDATVSIDYLLLDGRTLTKGYVVPANSRVTIAVDGEDIPGVPGKPLDNVAVSSDITSTNGVPILVERTMWWPSPAMSANFWTEAHNSAGARETGTRWALAEGETGGRDNAETYILIANTSAQDGQVRVLLHNENGGTETRTFAVRGRSRLTVSVSADFPETAGHRFGAIVESLSGGGTVSPSAPQIVVERAMYMSPDGQTWTSGTNALATRLDR